MARLLTRDGRVVPELVQFCIRHGIQVDEGMTAQQLSAAMQEKWLRKTEHQYQVPAGAPSEDNLAILCDLGLVDAINAETTEETFPPGTTESGVLDYVRYAGAIVIGATLPAVRKRLAFLIRQHTDINHIYMLGGARPLDPAKESNEALCTPGELLIKKYYWLPEQMPKTEAEMMVFVTLQSKLPENWRFYVTNAPLQPMPEGKTRHPNTTDTVKEMLKFKPPAGKYLVVSSQPFVARQTLNVQNAIPPEFGIEVVGVGYEAPATTPLKTYLDEAARLLYEELASRKK